MLGVLVRTYPKISETFILQEILTLQHQFPGLRILSMQKPGDHVLHSAFDAVAAKVDYLTPCERRPLPSLIAHLTLLAARPWAYCSTFAFALRRPEGGSVADFCQAVECARLARRSGIRHIHAHFATEPAGLAELVCRLTGTGYSISAHAKDIYLNHAQVLCRKMAGACFVVTCSEYNRRFLAALNRSETPIVRVYHGIDPVRVRAEGSPQAVPSPAAIPRILSVGRLREKKGFSCLIEACRLLRDRGYRFECDIVGYGPERALLERCIERGRLNAVVHLHGKMAHGALADLYRRASLFALPCRIAADGDRDGIPNVLMEAMCFGLAVVSTRVSAIPELIVDGDSGVLVEPGDCAGLAAALGRLLDRPELRTRLGAAGRLRVGQHFSARRHNQRLKELLASALREMSAEGVEGRIESGHGC